MKKVLVVKVGSDDRPATSKDINDLSDQMEDFRKDLIPNEQV